MLSSLALVLLWASADFSSKKASGIVLFPGKPSCPATTLPPISHLRQSPHKAVLTAFLVWLFLSSLEFLLPKH